jgi:hypothetical protein
MLWTRIAARIEQYLMRVRLSQHRRDLTAAAGPGPAPDVPVEPMQISLTDAVRTAAGRRARQNDKKPGQRPADAKKAGWRQVDQEPLSAAMEKCP